jgi:hypothetical protein
MAARTKSEVFAVKAGEVAAEVDGRSAEQGGGDWEQSGFAAGQRAEGVFGHLIDVDPPPAGSSPCWTHGWHGLANRPSKAWTRSSTPASSGYKPLAQGQSASWTWVMSSVFSGSFGARGGRPERRTAARRQPSGRWLRSFDCRHRGGAGRRVARGEGAVAALEEIGEIGSEAFGDRALVTEILAPPVPSLLEEAGGPGQRGGQDHADERWPAGVEGVVDDGNVEDGPTDVPGDPEGPVAGSDG